MSKIFRRLRPGPPGQGTGMRVGWGGMGKYGKETEEKEGGGAKGRVQEEDWTHHFSDPRYASAHDSKFRDFRMGLSRVTRTR
jgi:hypothetical protein